MDLAASLRAFVDVLELGSMSAAARRLGLSQPAVTKLIRNLEAHVGAPLLERGPTGARPTDHGRRLRERLGDTLSTIDAAIGAAKGEAGSIGGTLRLHAPACLGERHLHDVAQRFRSIHPDVAVDLTLENTPADLRRGDIDLAFGMTRAKAQGIVQSRIGLVRRYLVAAPSYVEAYAPIDTPAALAAHDLIVTDVSLAPGDTLPLQQDGKEIEMAVNPVLRTNSVGVLLEALRSGRGIGTAQRLLVDRDLADGRLVRVLPQWEIRPSNLYLSYPAARWLRPVARAFVDFAVPALRRIPGIERHGAGTGGDNLLSAQI